jgi:DNA-binding FadR family transcriptional regulator
LPEQVFQQLVGAVLEGRYAPGERLPTQRALAAELGVNMASLREGIKRLEQLRLVEVRHGDAMRVRDWRLNGGLDVLAYAIATDPALLAPLLEARRMLLREAAGLAAQRRTEGHARALADLADQLAAARDDAGAQLVDLTFMAAVIDAAGNVIFQLILNSIRELYLAELERFRPLVADRGALAPLYEEVARAIAAGEPGGAAAAMERLVVAQEERMAAAGGGAG